MKPFYLITLFFTILFFYPPTGLSQKIEDEPLVITGKYHGLSRPLRELPQLTEEEFNALVEKGKNRLRSQSWEPKQRLYPFAETALPKDGDPIRQDFMGTLKNSRPAILNFDGQTSPYKPSDVNGDVNETHYFQTINTVYAIYNKSGQLVAGPTNLNLLFEGVTGANYNDGDPIVLWDEAAQRWLVSEFSVTGTNDYMLVAVSTSPDPTGTWHRYSFDVDDMPDYPKLGVWRDGYYLATNTATAGRKDIYVLERNKMLIGATAQMVGFKNTLRPNSGFHVVPPVDNDGPLAPEGSPGIFITINDDAWGGSDQIWIYELSVNWAAPTSSTFTRTQQINVPPFDSNFGSTWDNIAQKGTTQKLDAVNQILMQRPQYRNFGTHQTIVANHTVDVSGTDQAGIRWYELRRTGTGPWSIRQTGTYAPDNHSRWMASMALTPSGKLGLFYSISSTTLNPGLRYTGQSSAAYAAGTGLMDVVEEVVLEGTLSQTGTNRWGDYFMIAIDPSDNETFWATGQYVGAGNASKTRIATFRIGNAPLVTTTHATNVTPTSATLNGTVNPNTLSTTYYFEWGTSTAYGNTTTITSAGSGSTALNVSANISGLIPGTTYHFRIVGTNADGTTYGQNRTFIPGGVMLTTNSITNIGLNTAVSGGNITSDGGSTITARGVCWSTSPNPMLSGGNFTINGNGTGAFTSNISGLSPSTTYYVRAYATNDFGTFYGNQESFTTLCGVYVPPITENFNTTAMPNCWSTVSLNGNNQVWQIGTITGYSPLPALTGNYAYLNSDAYGSGNTQNADLRTPVLNLSAYGSVTLAFKHYFRSYTGSSVRVSYSINGGSTWTDIQSWTTSTANPATFSQSIPAVAGQSNVMFRWNFTGTWGYYWAVDDIQITGTVNNEVTNFTATAASQTQINLSWQGANVMLVWSPNSTLGTPVNGTAYSAGQTIPGGGTVLYVGTNSTFSHTNLNPATTYYYKAYLIQTGNIYSNGVTANATTQSPAAFANVLLRPLQADIASATSQGAVLMQVGYYPSNEAKYRLFNGTAQYNVWNGSQFVTSNAYADNPSVPGTPTTESTWWIIYQRGNNAATEASYRDRLSPYSANYQTVVLPTANAINSPVSINGSIPFNASYPLNVKYVILGYDAPTGGNLLAATSSDLSTGSFNLVVEQGTIIQRIEVRSILNQLMESQTGTWPGSGNPPAVFNLSGGGSYCQGTNPSGIGAVLSGSETNVSYQLLRNNLPYGNPIQGTGSPLNWDNLIAGTYTVVATNSNSSQNMDGQVIVSETPTVPVSVALTVSQNNVCQGTSVIFTANPTNPGSSPLYQWTVNGSNAGTNSPTFSYVPADGDQVQVLLTSSESCAQPAVATSNIISMQVQTPPVAAISILPSQNPVCQGTQVSYTAQLLHAGTNPTIQWFVNSVLQSAGTATSFSYTPANNDIVEALLISSLSCVANNPASSNGVLMEVLPLHTPQVSISTNSTTLCNGQQALVTATANNAGSNPIYQWLLNGSPTGTNSPTFSFVPANGDQVTVTLTSSLNCLTGNPALSNALIFTVNPPTITLNVSPSGAGTANFTGTPTIGQNLTLSASPAPGFNFQSWTNAQGTVISTQPSFSFTPTQCSHTLTANFSSGVTLSGKLAYFNPVESALPSASQFMIQLFDGSNPVSAPQPLAPNYSFDGLVAGKTYTLKLWEEHSSGSLGQTWHYNNWGGVSALDALIVSHMSTENPVVANFPWIMPQTGQPMTPFALAAADVNNSSTITGLDALILMYRTIGFPGTNPFPGGKHNFMVAGKWLGNANASLYPSAPDIPLQPHGAYLPSSAANSVYYQTQLPQLINGPNYFNIYLLANGDLNASYLPTTANNKNSTTLNYDATIEATIGQTINIPLRINQNQQLAAITIGLAYNNQLLSIDAVQGFEIFFIDQQAGQVRIAWMDPQGRNYAAGQKLLNLQAKVLGNIQPGIRFMELMPITELVNRQAQILQNVPLATEYIATGTTGLPESSMLSHHVMPNPFENNAIIKVNLPEPGKLRINIYNYLGQFVTQLAEGNYPAGMSQLTIKAADLPSNGAYFYTVELQTTKNLLRSKGNLILNRH